MDSEKITVIIPAKNESLALAGLIPKLKSILPNATITIVNDGSTDTTEDICKQHQVNCINHAYSMGNGAAIKTGLRSVNTEYIVCMDGDGQHKPEDIPRLLEPIMNGTADMVVGSRASESQASKARLVANTLYNKLSSWIVGHTIKDLTSGFRAVKADKFKAYIDLLPNTFSYPTTITMAFFRSGFTVKYVSIIAEDRIGKSHINLFKDGFRFFMIIFKIGTLYSPLKIFTPIAGILGLLGTIRYIYTYLSYGVFTNMSALLYVSCLIVFLMGLLSEQITSLSYSLLKNNEDNKHV